MTNRTHREFSPSQSERFTLCRGSVNLLRKVTARPSSAAAIEGTEAHEVLEAGLTNKCTNAIDALAASKHRGTQRNQDFLNSVNDALNYVWTLLDELEMLYGDAQLFIEYEVNPPVQSAPGQAAGYCDIAIYSAKARRLWVIDFKHGYLAKAVIGNTQVKQYAAGFLYDERGFIDPTSVDIVTLVIIQPRAYHPDGDTREYDVTPGDIFDYLMDLDLVIADCLRFDAPLTPGDDQCRFCDARPTCPAVEAKGLALVNETFANIRDVAAPKIPDVNGLDVNRLSYIKQHRAALVGFLDAVDDKIEELIKSGVPVPGFKQVATQARRKWHGNVDERMIKMAALIGVPDYELYNVEPKGIVETEAMMVAAFKARAPRGKKEKAAEEAHQTFAFFTTKETSGNTTIVPEDDPRPSASKASLTFGSLPSILPPPSTKEI